MPFLNRWNYETQEYDAYGVPDDWNVKSYSDDMDEIINCPHCGNEVTYGSCYTSREIHYKEECTRENAWHSKKSK